MTWGETGRARWGAQRGGAGRFWGCWGVVGASLGCLPRPSCAPVGVPWGGGGAHVA
jgi:hypothetical protein